MAYATDCPEVGHSAVRWGAMADGRVCVRLLFALAISCARPEPATPNALPTPPPSRETPGSSPSPMPREPLQVGYATWYGARFAGRRTANGERFDPNAMTAAHRSLPFGTWVEVRRVDTGESIRVRITDRGPWGHEDRIIDLSRAAARALRIVHEGLTKVSLRVVAGP
jgi:rare lipoprotein A (peptidoglycan hydrolase)